jgi:POT family proton-dependent oligopeptide transporter
MYGSLAIVGFVAGCLFLFCFRSDRKRSSETLILEAVPVQTDDNTPGRPTEKSD